MFIGARLEHSLIAHAWIQPMYLAENASEELAYTPLMTIGRQPANVMRLRDVPGSDQTT